MRGVGPNWKERRLVNNDIQDTLPSNLPEAYGDYQLIRDDPYPFEYSGPTKADLDRDKSAAGSLITSPPADGKKTFVDLRALDDSIKRLQSDLNRLTGDGDGDGDGESLPSLIAKTELTVRDFGQWEAAQKLQGTFQQSGKSMEEAIQAIVGKYQAVINALKTSYDTTKAADGSAAEQARGIARQAV
jgi:hypothetical protein